MISFSWEIVTTLFTHRQSTHTSCSCKWETTVLITKETGTRRRRHLMLGNFYVLLMVGGWQLTSPWSKILERVGLAPNPCYGQIHVFYVLTSTCLPLLGWVTYSRQSLILKLMNYILETIFKKFVILCVSVLIFKMYTRPTVRLRLGFTLWNCEYLSRFLSHHRHIFEPLKIGSRRSDTFHCEYHENEGEDDTEDANDSD